MRWTIGTKIGAGFALVLVIFTIIGISSYFSLNSLINAAKWQNHTYEVTDTIAETFFALQDMETGQRGFIITGEDSYLEPYNNAKNKIEPSIEALRKLTVDNPAQQQRIVVLKAKVDERLRILNGAIALRKEKGFESARQAIMTDKGKKAMDEVRTLFGEIKTEETILLQQRSSQVNTSTLFAKNLIVWGMLFAIILLALTGFITSRNIANPLAVLSAIASRITAGDLSINISPDERSDEIGVLTQAFRQMTENFRSSITSITEGVALLGSSASEILATTTQVAAGAAENVVAINETTTTVEEIRQAAQLSSQKAKGVSESSQKLATVSQTGQKAVEETTAEINRIRVQMESIAKTIVSLSEQSQNIGGIIASVTDIADQSNLLAVNASIEAAKAGEQGKGFAVVAQEIRSLAEQSKQATVEVRRILNDVQKSTNMAVMVTEQGSKAVESGLKQALQAGEVIKALTTATSEAVQASMQIVASSQQQVVGMDQIGKAMGNINQATAENSASIKQTETAAKNINELGQKLKQLVSQYKI
jgi:methyl-accepting chemotaxis protein